MLLITKFDISADIIDVPPFIINDIKSYQEQFFIWLCDKNNDHAYWHYQGGKKYGLNYRSNALIEWLNTFPLADYSEKAEAVEIDVSEYDKALPSIFF